MQKLLLLLDTEAGGTTAVLAAASGYTSDDVDDAVARLDSYFGVKVGGKEVSYTTQGASFAKRYDINEKFKGNDTIRAKWVEQYNVVRSRIRARDNWTDIPLYYVGNSSVHTTYGYDADTYKVYDRKGSKINGLDFYPQAYISLKTDF